MFLVSFVCVGCNTSAQCILDGVPSDECDGLIFAAAAMLPYATITVASCHYDFCTKFSCIISHAGTSANRKILRQKSLAEGISFNAALLMAEKVAQKLDRSQNSRKLYSSLFIYI